jgi:DNA-binding NtrC family response regulator
MRILLTGYADLDAIEASINDGEVFRYLMKPCPPDDLKKAITMAVDAARNSNPVREEIELPRAAPMRRKPAELIPFPAARRASNPAKPAPTPTGRKSGIKTAASRTAERPSPIEVLVLSADKALYSVIEQVTEGHPVLRAATVDQALKLLAENRIGVMVTDTTANAAEVENLTKILKQEVPELVTIVASDRSDAHTLISLINEGQIYRFLLKPVSRGQSRLWVTSAIRKFAELSQNSRAVDRYRVVAAAEPGATGLLAAFKTGFETLRSRLNRT